MIFQNLDRFHHVVYRTLGPQTTVTSDVSYGGDAVGCGMLPKPDRGRRRLDFCYKNVYCMVYVLQGSGIYETASGEVHMLEAGSLFHRFPDVPHRTIPDWDGNWVEFFVAMPRSLYDLFLEAGLLDIEKPVWQLGADSRVMECMLTIRDLLESDSYNDTLIGLEKMQSLVRLAWESYTGLNDASEDPIVKACRYLCDDALMGIPAEAIAARVDMGFESFRKKFREKMGISPGAFRVRHKMNRACELLINTDRPVSVIATDLGYADTFAFSQQFKKKMGVSPGAYRDGYR